MATNLMGRVGGGSTATAGKKGKFKEVDRDLENSAGDDDPEVALRAYEDVKSEIDQIDDNAGKADNITNRLSRAASNNDEKEVMKQLAKLMADNNKVAESVKSRLKSLKLANDKASLSNGGSSMTQMKINEWNSCARKFQNSSTKFQKSVDRFNNELKARQKRLIGAVDPDISSAKLEALVNDPRQGQEYIQQALQMDLGDAMMDRLVEIEARTQGMQQIYESLEELRTMWSELNFLITEQQEMVDNIDSNVQRTNEYVHQATTNLEKAEKDQKKGRKCRCMALGICFALLMVVVFAVLGGTGVFTSS